jgi:YD repeat-containing protein
MLSDSKRTITYNQANKPISIKTDTDTTTFNYNSSGNRYIKTFNNGFGKTHYIGKLFERTYPTNTNSHVDKLVKIKKKENYGITEPIKVTDSFIHTDNLGNIIAISDKDGKITNRRSYKPFGEIRHVLYKEGAERANNITTSQMLELTTNRSFTGYESIENSDGLVHMNGRVI